MNPDRTTFLHVDMDAFFASVEQHDCPELKGKPVIVGASPKARGVVCAASYEARTFGVHAAMPSRTAYQKCPNAIFLPVNMERYKAVSRHIMQIFQSYTPWVQPLSIDEAFLDITGSQRLFGEGKTIAAKIRDDIHNKTGLTASVGVAPNMFLAKIASDMNKPDGLTLVPFDQYEIEQFLAPLPIKRMWGIGKTTQKALLKYQIKTIGDLQTCSIDQLQRIMSERAAQNFKQLAHGIDSRTVELETEPKSISNETTFKEDVADHKQIIKSYLKLIDKVGKRLRMLERYATTVHLKIRWHDFSTTTRQSKLKHACCDDFSLRAAGTQLLRQYISPSPVRLIGFGVSGLSHTSTPKTQLDLFENPDTKSREKQQIISETTDRIRKRFGDKSLRRGSDL